MTGVPPTSRLRLRDGCAVALASLRGRRLRVALTAGGVAIGIASMVAVLGLSTSSRANVLAALDALGTDMLTVRPDESFVGEETPLPASAPAAARHLPAVEHAAATATLETTVRRTDLIPSAQTGGIRVAATEPALLDTLGATLTAGAFFDTRTNHHPAVVLGADAAQRLGIHSLEHQPLVRLADQWFAVIGVLDPVPLAPELDSTALIGWPAATTVLGLHPTAVQPTSLYVRTQPDSVDDVRDLLPRTANPETPEAVDVSRPSDALAARATAHNALTALLVGLGGVALLVGGVGIANVMIIAVLERRTEIGLRRALGATRAHIRTQFLLEAITLAGTGGLIGVAAGAAITASFAHRQGWPYTLPAPGLAGALAVTILVGGIAGIYPAHRAARLQPADAVRPR